MNWFLLAFVAPFLWALVALSDTYFVNGVYEDEYDGTIISGIFQCFPWLFVLFGVIEFVPLPGMQTLLALVAGALFLLSFFFYFKALFVANDSALMQIIWNLSVPLVPFIAWLFLGEMLLTIHYAGIGLAFCGIVLFNLKLHGKSVIDGYSKVIPIMLWAVTFLSFSMVAEKKVFETQADNFWSVFLLFSIGGTIATALLLLTDKKKISERMGKIARLSGTYFFIFFLAESLSVIGTVTSQRAISLTPSVSFIATIESLVPVFVMLLSFLLAFLFRWTGHTGIEQAYRRQTAGLTMKIMAVIVIMIGIYMIS